jgi:hypothetical protein
MKLTPRRFVLLLAGFVALASLLPMIGWPGAMIAIFAYFLLALLITRA